MTAAAAGAPRSVTVVVSEMAPVGGMERAAFEITRRLVERGWNTTVIAAICTIEPAANLKHVKLRRPSRPHTLTMLADLTVGSLLLRRHRRGVVHVHTPMLLDRTDVITSHFCSAAYRDQAASLSRAEGTSWPYRLNAWLANRMAIYIELLTYSRRRAGAFACVSSGLADELAGFFPKTSGRMTVIPNGVDRDYFRPSAAGRRAMRAELGIPDDAPVVLFIGGDWGRKGLALAIAAVARSSSWHLIVAGDGDQRAFAAQARACEAGDRVHFTGKLSDPRGAYQAADALLLPTSYEAFSLVMLEAASSGLALLTPPVNGSAELMRDGENGVVIERDEAMIAAVLDRLAADRAGVAAMGASARERSAEFDWESICDQYEAMYERVA